MFIQVVPFRERATATMVRPRGLVDKAGPVGLVHYELLRGGRILVPKTLAFNAVNNFAKNSFLERVLQQRDAGRRLLHRARRLVRLLRLQRDRRDRCPLRLG